MAKLILTNEVAGLGSAGDVVEVKNGFARNYLIPQGFAVAWTRGGEKQVASIRAARESRAIHDHDEAVALKDALESNKVKLVVKAGSEGRLFVELAVGLGSRAVHGRAARTIENAKLDAGDVDGLAHQAVQGVNLADQLALAYAAYRWVARHDADGVDFVRDEERSGAHPCRGGTGLAARMPTTDYDDIVGRRS